MTGLSRRRFLAGLGASGALAASGLSVWAWRRDPDAPAPPAGPGGPPAGDEIAFGVPGRTLVVLELAGGNDALSTVVPHADARYHELRPTLAVTDPIDLDGAFGLSPRLRTLARAYAAGRLAIVHGVGFEHPDLSHFESLHRWWTADAPTEATGWIGRYLDATVGFDDPLAAVSLGAAPSPALAGVASFATAIADAGGLRPDVLDGDARRAMLDAWSRMVPQRLSGGLAGEVERAIAGTASARERLAAMLGDEAGARRPGGGRAGLGMADALALAARLAAAADAPRVVYVQAAGDFDTHRGQAARHDALMQQLDEGVDAFLRTLEAAGAADRVVLATVSEFGRRVRENGSGTDHGTAAAHLVVGPVVQGGMHGEPPSLRDLDEAGNPVPTTAVHDYYATLLDWLGVDGEPVLGRPVRPLPVFRDAPGRARPARVAPPG